MPTDRERESESETGTRRVLRNTMIGVYKFYLHIYSDQVSVFPSSSSSLKVVEIRDWLVLIWAQKNFSVVEFVESS